MLPDSTRPRATNIASVPALQANSKSATCTSGPMPRASISDRAAGLDRVGVGLGADVDRADLLRVDARPRDRVRRRHRDGDRVLVEARDRLLLEQEPVLDALGVLAPLVGDLVRRDPVARNVCSVADDSCHVRLLRATAIRDIRLVTDGLSIFQRDAPLRRSRPILPRHLSPSAARMFPDRPLEYEVGMTSVASLGAGRELVLLQRPPLILNIATSARSQGGPGVVDSCRR